MTKENLLESAVQFAARAHAGQVRKGTCLPYIVHPMEVTAICAGLTDDAKVLAAAILHDVVEDTDAWQEYNERVAAVFAGELG